MGHQFTWETLSGDCSPLLSLSSVLSTGTCKFDSMLNIIQKCRNFTVHVLQEMLSKYLDMRLILKRSILFQLSRDNNPEHVHVKLQGQRVITLVLFFFLFKINFRFLISVSFLFQLQKTSPEPVHIATVIFFLQYFYFKIFLKLLICLLPFSVTEN